MSWCGDMPTKGEGGTPSRSRTEEDKRIPGSIYCYLPGKGRIGGGGGGARFGNMQARGKGNSCEVVAPRRAKQAEQANYASRRL